MHHTRPSFTSKVAITSTLLRVNVIDIEQYSAHVSINIERTTRKWKEEGGRKKEEGRRKKERGRKKKARKKKEEDGRRKKEDEGSITGLYFQ